jgi:Trypsin-co-occurring domain 1
MGEAVRFETDQAVSVLVEADDVAFGVEEVRRGRDGIVEGTKRLEDALAPARATVAAALQAFGGLGFEELSFEFGVKLTAQAGALIARTSGEGHLTVTARWTPKPSLPLANHGG